MEKYKASKNNEEELTNDIPEKTEEEKKQGSTEKAVDLAGELALDYFTAGKGSQVKDALGNVPVVGGAVNKVWDGAVKDVSKVVSKTPAGDVLKAADDMGVTDLAKDAKGMLNMSKGKTSGVNSATNNPNKNLSNSSSPSISVNNESSKKNLFSGGSTNSGPLTDNIMGNIMGGLPKSMKIKLYAIGIGVIFLLMIFITVFADQDIVNLQATNNNINMSDKGGAIKNCTAEQIENKLVMIGDSRTVGMQTAVNKENVVYIAEVGEGYNLLESKKTEIENYASDSNKVLVFNLGVNDLVNIDKYINFYKELINNNSSAHIYFMSINPVDEAKEASNGYSVKNSDIDNFNNKLKSSFSNKYVDINSSIQFDTSDGLHYSNETYEEILNTLTQKLSATGQIKCGGASSGDLLAKLEELGKWYIENVPTYQTNTGACGTSPVSGTRKYYENPYTNRKYGDDCTEFTAAYMDYVCGSSIQESYSGGMIDPNGSWAKSIEACGWKGYFSDEIDSLQPGDVLISHGGMFYSGYGEHGEIYIDENSSFGWGAIQCNYPTPNSITKSISGGHTHYLDAGHDYITIYRYSGATTDDAPSNNADVNPSNLNIIKMFDSSFNHGKKPKSNQKYIMLHDTEMAENAKTVINAWKNQGTGVAAHFVVDRDGTIIQAVDMDTITHHAGYGGPGNFDAKFDVGNNDGKGNGDDLVGTQPLSGYTSYGMNSYSIGIEMCHKNGETYPEAQLKALDNLIAYIDKYYGFKATIIDHKTWRPSNSDTDANFATYFNNYKTKRHH